MQEVEHMKKAALAYYDDHNLCCCFTADDASGAMREKFAVANARAKELVSLTRDSEAIFDRDVTDGVAVRRVHEAGQPGKRM